MVFLNFNLKWRKHELNNLYTSFTKMQLSNTDILRLS